MKSERAARQGGPIKEAAAAAATSTRTIRPVCDYCSEPGATWLFPARPIIRSVAASNLYMALDGRWRACDACMPMAERGDWKRLLRRVRRLSPDDYLSSPVLVAELVALWLAFEQRRLGPPRRIDGQHETRRGEVAS